MTSELLMKLELEKKAAGKKLADIKPLIPATTGKYYFDVAFGRINKIFLILTYNILYI